MADIEIPNAVCCRVAIAHMDDKTVASVVRASGADEMARVLAHIRDTSMDAGSSWSAAQVLVKTGWAEAPVIEGDSNGE